MLNKELNSKIVFVSPLLYHNGQLANPLNPIVIESKKISSKKKNMTDADLERLSYLEFLGSLYLENGEPCIPAEVMEATIRTGAKTLKKGKDVQRALECPCNFQLVYDGPRKPEELWNFTIKNNGIPEYPFRFACMVRIGNVKVLRMRPIFKEWSANIIVRYDNNILNDDDVVNFIKIAGEMGALMDWFGKFGKYRVENADIKNIKR